MTLPTPAPAPRVLFVCVSNAGKSPTAAALTARAAGQVITANSAGIHPKSTVNALSAQVLAEVGVDVSGHVPKALSAEAVSAADLVVPGEEARPDLPAGATVQRWVTDEPSTRGIERMRIIRDDITTRVHTLREHLLHR